MYTIANQKSNNTPRFKNMDVEIVYKLFDAFVQATLVENKAIDFSRPMLTAEDGSLKFATRDENFSDIITGMLHVNQFKNPKHPAKPVEPKDAKQPVRKEGEDDEAFKKRMDKYNERHANYIKKRADYEKAMQSFDSAKYEQEMEKYSAQKAVIDDQKTKDQEKHALLYAHLNWLWTLGMTNNKTTCGAENIAILGFEENGAAFNGKAGLWKARMTPSSKNNDLDLICTALERFVTWPLKPANLSLAETKMHLARFAFKSKNTMSIDMRNGLLHLCNPDTYICLYSLSDKIDAVKLNENVLIGENLTSRTLGLSVLEGYSVNFKDVKAGYDADLTEEKLCRLYDILSKDPAIQNVDLPSFINKKLLKVQ